MLKLRAFAIKVLSLTCSSSACEHNWSTFNQVRTKKRNKLAAEWMDKLVYVMFNKKLKDGHINHQKHRNAENDKDQFNFPFDKIFFSKFFGLKLFFLLLFFF